METRPRTASAARALDAVSVFLSSAFYCSYVPAALVGRFGWGAAEGERGKWTGAGFVGSVWGALTYLFLPARVATSPVAVLVGLLLAVFFSGRAERVLDSHDDSRIVIDEWIGMWIAAFGLRQAATVPFAVAFVLFRFFDVVKGPWGQALQRLPGGWGVTMDDVGAGLLANLFTRLFLRLF